MSSLGSQERIRDINSHLVLQSIINDGPLSRADLAKNLGLTKATVSSIVQALIDSSFVKEIGSLDTSVGRKPIMLSFNGDCGSIIAIDLSVRYITILLTNLKGDRCLIDQYPNPGETSLLLARIIEIIDITMAKAPETIYGVIGISIGVHGVVHNNTVLFTPYYELTDLNIAEILENHFNIPIYMENEANLSALGEKIYYYDYSNLINISVHSGIGLGIIVDDKLYVGRNGYAGEFGHTIIVPHGKACPCGNSGCIEQYASEQAIINYYQELTHTSINSPDPLMAAYSKGDNGAARSIERFIDYMSIGINNILNTFNPDIIVINSIFTMSIPDVIPRIMSSLQSHMNQSCQIVPSYLQDMAILLGGVYICSKNFLGIDSLVLNSELFDTGDKHGETD